VNLNRLAYAGALHDPVAALLLCAPQAADYTVVNGKFVVREGQVATVDMGPVMERHNEIALEMVRA
jgi:hypothetical protein